ncbi:uncharacterized protein TRUGW13939_07549 [Talaromyces rugulosus]|uniref:Uncharacterized protein n=1 Tax=Talaromyces rugulosus TaxID=121627 RepID=A0A7H8R207_TALRU|nr:uncharacterized protein TRUGW13939_07549 [Talaromyces rugulosus]QKX60404.1 hypothetical protein TRUGW13939_07549 [Talaromyces rugulosus]
MTAVLVISLSRYLGGEPVSNIIDKNWTKHPQEQASRFNSVGFDFDANDIPTTLKDLEAKIYGQEWDGIMVGWCLRGNPDRTALFEKVVTLSTRTMQVRPQMKLMFCAGPNDIADATLRNFPVSSV